MFGQLLLRPAICLEEFDELLHTPIFSQNEFQSSRIFQSDAVVCVFSIGDNLTMGTRRTISTEDGRKGHFIAEWLKFRKMTQEQLAAEAGYATSSINQLINGKQGYSQAALEAVARSLRCQPWELIAVNPIESPSSLSAEMAAKALRSALIAFGVDQRQLPLAIGLVERIVASQSSEEQSEQNPSDDQSQPASRRRAVTPSA